MNKGRSNDDIQLPAVGTVADILLATIKLGRMQNSSQTALADTFKMVNHSFAYNVFSDTRYLVGKMFEADDYIEYDALCCRCKKYMNKFDITDLYLLCTTCNERVFLKSSTYTDFFVIFNIKNKLRSLLENNDEYFQNFISSRFRDKELLKDIPGGKLHTEFILSLDNTDQNNSATLTLNSNGSPVFENSNYAVWPAQVIVNELPFDVRNSNQLVDALWFSKSKPDMNIFLSPFVDSVHKMADTDFLNLLNEERVIKIFTVCCCVDSGARLAMQGFTQYNGYSGCT